MRVSATLGFALVAAAVNPALADGAGAGADPKLIPRPGGKPAATRLSHAGQLEVSVRAAVGLRAIAPYDNEFCGKTDAEGDAGVCTGRAPFALDFELGYGIARKVDLVVELRIGIEGDFGRTATDTERSRVFHVSPGARFFFSDAGATKLFTTAQLVIDASGYRDVAGARLGTDVGVRNLSGVWVDLDRAYGFYAFVGETATFARWLRLELEGGVGIQGRFL